MLGAALHLVPILGAEAEKNKTLFYVCGGALALWAVILAVGIGLRRPEFPGNLRGERTVITITVVLVLATTSAAVIVSGPRAEAKRAAESSETTPTSTAGKGQSTSLALQANPSGQLTYDAKLLRAQAGTVSIDFSNQSPLEHDVTIAEGSKVLGATPAFIGGKRTLTLHLKPGTYTFYCSVPGHRQAGMEGELKVS